MLGTTFGIGSPQLAYIQQQQLQQLQFAVQVIAQQVQQLQQILQFVPHQIQQLQHQLQAHQTSFGGQSIPSFGMPSPVTATSGWSGAPSFYPQPGQVM